MLTAPAAEVPPGSLSDLPTAGFPALPPMPTAGNPAPSPALHAASPIEKALPGTEGPRRHPRWPLLSGVITIVVVAAAVAVTLILTRQQPASPAGRQGVQIAAGQSATATGTTAPATEQSSASPAASGSPRQQAAQALSVLLAGSGTDRAKVTAAVSSVEDCSADLSHDETVFRDSESSRQSLLSQLSSLRGRSALPAPLLQDLALAWRASSAADSDFAQWTQDEISQGCSTDQSDASLLAATGPDNQATTYKKEVARLWAPIAAQYGLPVYQYDQI